MMNIIRRFFRRIQVKVHYWRSKFDIVIQDKVPHNKIEEKYENAVKWILRTITVIGIASSLIAFPVWYYSLAFSIVLFLIEQVFEQIIFTRTVMLVQPLPQNWDGSKWTSMYVAMDDTNIFLGFGFSDKSVGTDFFNTLLAWNDGKKVNDGNIQLTLVQENKHKYSVHVYPTVQRAFVRDNLKQQELDFDKRANAGKELSILVAQMSFCKVFPMSKTCAYAILKDRTENVYVQIYDTSKVDNIDPSTYYNAIPNDAQMILFKQITVCHRRDLTRDNNTMEYYNVPK